MSGNGHTVRDAGGDSFFTVKGSITATFADTHFEGFHATGFANEVPFLSPQTSMVMGAVNGISDLTWYIVSYISFGHAG